MITLKYTIIILLLSAFALNAKIVPLRVKISYSENYKNIDSALVFLYHNGEQIKQKKYQKNIPLNFNIDVNKNYQIIVKKEGYLLETVNLIDLDTFLANKSKLTSNIYLFKNAEEFNFTGKLIDREYKNKINEALVKIINLLTLEISYSMTNVNGEYNTKLRSGYNYEMQAVHEDYLKRYGKLRFCSANLSDDQKYCLKGFNDVIYNIDGDIQTISKMDRIEINKTFKVNRIYYGYNSYLLKSEAIKELGKLVVLLKDNPQIHIEIGSHADSRGNDNYNLELSVKRAKSVVDYIIYNKISSYRITSKGYGEIELLNHCENGIECDEKLHSINRRTEFKIIKIDGRIKPQIRQLIYSTINKKN